MIEWHCLDCDWSGDEIGFFLVRDDPACPECGSLNVEVIDGDFVIYRSTIRYWKKLQQILKRFIVRIGLEHSTRWDETYAEGFRCPRCNDLNLLKEFNYCPSCGIRLDWDEEIKRNETSKNHRI